MLNSLADAIIAENMNLTRDLLRSGAEVNQLDEYGFTPLIEAAIADNMDIAILLINQGADVNLQDMTGGTALHWAAENNNVALAELLLAHHANPNAYNFSGQPVLVMPLLRQHRTLKKCLLKSGAELEFAQDYINTKQLGHLFELVGIANIIDPQHQFVEVDFEGFYLEFSLGMIGESLAQFQNHFAAKKMRRYTNITQVIIDVISRAAELIKYQQYRVKREPHQAKISAIIREEPLLIPIGYEGHAITFVKYGDILAKCDRREDSRLYDNIVFYQMKRHDRMTPEFIENLIYQQQTSEFINEELHHILDLQPITELKISAQISGNCSWANVEATLPVLFFLLISKVADFQENIPRYKSLALNFFEQWRDWNKDRSIQFCMQSFQHANVLRKACKAEILAAILFQHYSTKLTSHNERIEAILAILTLPRYQHILKNYVKSYCYEDISEEGQRFMEMLKSYGYSAR